MRGPSRAARRRCRQDIQGCEACRPAGRAAHQTGDQFEDRKGAWRRSADIAAAARRRGDRIELSFAAVPESLVGTFRTWRDVRLESVNRLKADMINAEKFQKWFELPKADLTALA